MSQALEISLVQDRRVVLTVAQGVAFELPIEWLKADESPRDISGKTFLAQLRDDYVSRGGKLIHQFSVTPDSTGNRYAADVPRAATTFYFSDELARSLKAGKVYFFEAKMLDAGNPIDRIEIEIKAVMEVART